MSDVFISYSRRDSPFVGELQRALEERGKSVWVDTRAIGPATDWGEEIGLGVESAHGVVFVISPDSVASKECAKELARAVELEKRIVPVMHSDPDGVPVPDSLAKLNFVMLRERDDFAEGVARLIEGLDTDIDWVHAHTRLGLRAAEWDAHGRNSSYLLRGSDLRDADAVLTAAAGKRPPPSALQLEYVAASRAGAKRRQRLLLSSVSVALAVAIALSVVALIERSSAVTSAHKAYSRQLAADAETQLNIDPELSVLLASKAYDVSPTAESVGVLRQSIATSKIRMAVRPADGVSQAQLTPDGRTLVTVGRSDGIVRLWRYPGGAALGSLPGVVAAPSSMSPNPVDGRILVASGGRAQVFSGTKLDYSAGTEVEADGWGAGGRYVATGARNGSVAILNGRTGAQLAASKPGGSRVVAVALASNARYMAAMRAAGVVSLYDLRKHLVYTLKTGCPSGGVGARVLFSPDATRLLTYGGSCDVELWKSATGSRVRNIGVTASDAAFTPLNPSGDYLVLAGEVAQLVNPSTGALEAQYLGNGGVVNAVAFSPDGLDVATSGADGTIQIWQPAYPTATASTLRADGGPSKSVAFAGSDGQVVSVDAGGVAARVWASGLQQPLAQFGDAEDASAAISPDGSLALTGNQADGLAVFDPIHGRRELTLQDSRGTVTPGENVPIDLGLVDMGRFAYARTAKAVELWRTSTGAPLDAISRPGATATAVGAAADAPWVAVGWSDGHIGLYDIVTRRSKTYPFSGEATFALTSDGATLAIAMGSRLEVVDLTAASTSTVVVPAAPIKGLIAIGGAAGHVAVAMASAGLLELVTRVSGRWQVRRIKSPAPVASLAMSRDGSLVVAGSNDQRARVWDVSSGDLIATVQEEHQLDAQPTVAVAGISADDQFLVTGLPGYDTTIWQISSGAQLERISEPFAAWSDSGQRVLTATEQGAIVETWTCDVCVSTPALRRLARLRVTRGFTPGERSQYLTGS